MAKIEDNKVFIEKDCPEHGNFKNTYWRNADAYKTAINYGAEPHKLENLSTAKGDCPSNCGLCEYHKSQTVLGLIDVTNRCNLRCPICFANAAASGTLYEPSQDEIRKMLNDINFEDSIICELRLNGFINRDISILLDKPSSRVYKAIKELKKNLKLVVEKCDL